MKKKFLRVLLVVMCQIFLLTAISFADSSEGQSSYFKFKTFKEVKPEIEGEIESKYLDEVEELYNEAYEAEKEKKYFKADDKWKELLFRLMKMKGEKSYTQKDFPLSFYNRILKTRDYRYGLLSFDKAYKIELSDYAKEIYSKDKRKKLENEMKRIYEKIEKCYEEVFTSKATKNEGAPYAFRIKRDELTQLLHDAKFDKLVFTKNRVCSFDNICFLEPKDFDEVLESNEDVIGEDEIEELKKLHEKAYRIIEDRKDLKAGDITCKDDIMELVRELKGDEGIEDLEELFEEIEEKLEEYTGNLYNSQYKNNKIKINELYEEMNKESN